MKRFIQNYEVLATSPLRKDALDIVQAGLHAIDTKTVLEKAVEVKNGILTIQGRQFNLSNYEHIYIVGFGKVACTAAQTLEKIFKGRIKDGAVIGLSEKVCQVVYTYAGTHPLPSQQNYVATKHIEEVARSAKEHDLVLVIISGGGSALLCSSMGECDQGVKLFDAFLQSGGTIEEMNLVRKHISSLKGGGLAKALYPATVAGLIFSDVPGGDITAVASGPTCFDGTTVNDAQAIIDKYDLGTFVLTETPKDPKYFERVHNFTIVSNITALHAMQQAAQELGYRAQLVSATVYADAQETLSLLSRQAIAGTMECMGGETKVTVPDGCTGKGGRNGYVSLSALPTLHDKQVFVSIASDGHDNTEAAGVLVDKQSLENAEKKNLNIEEYKTCLNSFPFFEAIGGHIITGPLESNVSDLMFLLTPKQEVHDAAITDITAEIVYDSRKRETIKVTVTAGVYKGSFAVPEGASTGENEVTVVSAKQALENIRFKVAPQLMGVSVLDQKEIDETLHRLGKTDRLDGIGGNVAIGVSVAACRAAAQAKHVEVWQYIAELFKYKEQAIAPRLFVNLINGGKHAKEGSPIQEHQIIPDTNDVSMALQAAHSIQSALGSVLEKIYPHEQITIGDEGGFVIPSSTLEEPFLHLKAAIAQAKTAVPIIIGADIAATSFYKKGSYLLEQKKYGPAELLGVYASLHKKFPLLQSIEDPFQEHDLDSFKQYHRAHPGVLTIGDDLTTTNKKSLKQAIDAEAINGIIIKPNQIGTVSDTLETMKLAYENKIWCIVSHRSGETMDDFIADLAYGTKCYGFKAGAPSMPERAAKYDRLLHISS